MNFLKAGLKLLLVIIFAVILSQCKGSRESGNKGSTTTEEKPNSPVEQKSDSLFASIERTACFGTCPVYKLYIYESGYSIFHGTSFVDNIGVYSSRISREEIDNIRQAAIEVGYFEMNDKYVNPYLMDFPSCITTVRNNSITKKIIVNTEEPPKQLITFQNGLDSLFKDAAWTLIRKDGGLED